ncbi:myb-like protein X [Pieris brassicae]|uniref:CCDC66 domain-containing protein n=1 Tax=Pieris brassicae TaxID=7116 RepID=A0A9P0THE5_PIEBR|nr:myb-like protein X [Pieris brassicae]CAH4028808.1 unnamed protein product [Pieris brassicae]
MLSVSKPVSLVQQKKQQWAREREEMSHLYLPWGSGERYTNRLTVRNQFASSLELHKQSCEYTEPIQRQRSPSLPPIHNIDLNKTSDKRTKEILNRNITSAKRFAFYDEDPEGDTSGYGSETVNHMHPRTNGTRNLNSDVVVAWQQEEKSNSKKLTTEHTSMGDGAWSARSSAAEEGRPRWGDRGVATGRLWEPTAPTARLPQMPNQNKGTPAWVERGLNNMIDNSSDVLAIDQRSSIHSGLDFDKSSYNGSDEGRSYLRGQNVPIEPEIKAQRETKRLKALELQNVILNQLEEREKRKQEEKEHRLREERLEELRIKRQQEEDRIRIEEEKRRNEDRQKLEQRKLDALKRALEDAEKKAKQEKDKRFNCIKQANAVCKDNINVVESSKMCYDSVRCSPTKVVSPTKSSRTYDVHSAHSLKKDTASQPSSTYNSPRSVTNGNLNLFIHNVPPLKLADSQVNIVPIGIAGTGEILSGQQNTIQLAVLVPHNLNNNYFNVSVNSGESSDVGKVLTPRKYRELRTKDVATQTDELLKNNNDGTRFINENERFVDKEYSNIDENAPQEINRNTLKKDKRLRSEERYKKDIENRPKWGANRPQAQYKKQSEKDPFYTQKRKLRHKHKSQRQYLSQSSEDSRSPSPPTRSDKISETSFRPRNSLSQSYWRSKHNSQDQPKNGNEGENEINVQEFISLSQITKNDKYDQKSLNKLSPTKRITLSQKFINDKYGSRRLWQDDSNEKNLKYSDIEIPKKI